MALPTTEEIHAQAYEWTTDCNNYRSALSKVWEQFVDDVYSILKRTHLENFFPSYEQSSSKY